MLHVYNCILLKMSTWASKHVEENNILWINNNQCIKLVINIQYSQFMMHGQKNLKLICVFGLSLNEKLLCGARLYISAVTWTSASKTSYPRSVCQQLSSVWAVCQIFRQPVAQSHDKGSFNLTNINLWTEALTNILKNIHTQNLRTW